MSDTRHVAALLKATTGIDRAAIDPGFVARGTLGVALSLAAGLAAHNPTAGVMAGVGALFVGVSSQSGAYRTRVAAMLWTACVVALSAFVGSIAGAGLALIVAVTALWGFAYGIVPLLGLSAQLAGMYAVLALVISSGFPANAEDAALRACVFLAGGMVQVLLLLLEWPFRSFVTERRALARACRALAAYAHDIPFAKLASPDPAVFIAASETLADPHPLARAAEGRAFREMFDAIGRIRARLTALTTDRYLLESYDRSDIARSILAITATASSVLAEMADAIQAGRPPAKFPALWQSLDDDVASLACTVRGYEDTTAGAAGRDAVDDARAFVQSLRRVYSIARNPLRTKLEPPRDGAGSANAMASIRDALQLVRENITWRSPYFKNALRVCAICALATLAGHVLRLHRPYWVPLTAVLILRPDYGTTFSRGLARVAGTLIGALMIAIFAALFKPGTVELAALIIAFACPMYAFALTNYTITAMAMTVIAISMVGIMGLPEGLAVPERIVATVSAAVLALGGYLTFPSWTHRQLRARLAHLLERQRDYLALVLNAYADPGSYSDRAMAEAEHRARIARTGVDTALRQMLDEPARPDDISVRTAIGFVAASHRLGVAALALRAPLGEDEIGPYPALQPVAHELFNALETVAAALRQRTVPAPFPKLGEAQRALCEMSKRDPFSRQSGVVMRTDLIVDSVYTMADLLERLESARRRDAAAISELTRPRLEVD